MSESGAETINMEAIDEGQAPAKAPSFAARAVRKLIKWSIMLAVFMVFFKFISGLQAEQKENFFMDAKRQAVSACGADAACIGSVKTHFDACIRDNYSSYKKGKYSRKYIFDLEGFQSCVQSKQ